MVSNRLGILSFISAAAIVSGILAGCGGSSATVQGISGEVITTGGITTGSSMQTTGTSSSSQPQQVQVTFNGQTVQGTLPAGETIAPGSSVSVTPPGVPIIQGLQLSSSTDGLGTKKIPSLATIKKDAPTSGAQGSVYVDGQNTGLTVTSNGSLSGYLILVPGNHVITAYGPFFIVGGSVFAPTQLTISTGFTFGVVVLQDGDGSIPVDLSVKLPVNGGTWAKGPYVLVTYPTPDFASGTGQLSIVVSATETISESRTVSNGISSYYSLGASAGSHLIPTTGIQSVTFNYIP